MRTARLLYCFLIQSYVASLLSWRTSQGLQNLSLRSLVSSSSALTGFRFMLGVRTSVTFLLNCSMVLKSILKEIQLLQIPEVDNVTLHVLCVIKYQSPMIEESPSLPRITLKDFDFKSNLSQKSSSRTNSLPKLFTVAQSLQNAYIYKNLKPDLGSLNEFIDGGLSFKHQLKKKKYQKPEESEEKKIKTFMLLRKKCPEDVLKNKQSTPLERKVAAKMMLDNIFAKEFGEEPEQFFHNNIKDKTDSESLRNIDKLIDKHTGLTSTLQQILNDFEKKEEETIKVSYYQTLQPQQESNQISQQKRVKKRIIYNQEKIRQDFNKLKLKYKTIAKIRFPQHPADSSHQTLQSIAGFKKYQSIAEFQEANKYKLDCRKAKSICLPTLIESLSTFIVDDFHFVIRKLPITCEQFLYLVFNNVSYQNIRVIYLEDIPVSDEVLCMFFQMLSRYAFYIEQITLIKIPSVSSAKTIPILKTLISSPITLKILSINNCSIDTKSFCVLCLGIGESVSLQYLEASKNQIDGRALKSLQIIVRYLKELLYIDLSGNRFQLNPKENKQIKGFLDNYKNKTVFLS